jgi:hypothetical protein
MEVWVKKVRNFRAGRSILDFGFWILDFGFWIEELQNCRIAELQN